MSTCSVIWATVVLAYLALILFVLQACACCFHRLRRIRCMWSGKWAPSWQSNDPMEARVLDLMTKRRLHRARLAAVPVSHLMAFYLVITLAQMHGDKEVSEVFTNEQHAQTALTQWELVAAIVLLWATRLSVGFPWVVTSWTLDLLFGFIMARLAVRELLNPDLMQRDYYIHFIGGQRLLMILLVGNAKVGSVVNIAYSISNFGSFLYFFGWAPNQVYELLSLLTILLTGWLFHSWIYSEARATLEAKILARSEASMHRLLSAMCDAVVHLGPDCIIRYPVPKLEVLLLKCRTHAALQSTPFADLLLDGSERDRFYHFLSSVPKEPPRHDLADQEKMAEQENVACTFHSHMKDATDTKVPVQIFHGSYLDINEQVCHIIGLREDQETVLRMQATEPHASIDGGLSTVMEHCTMPMRGAASDCSSVYSFESGGEVAAWVDTGTEFFKVVRCSVGFSALCGPSTECIELLQWTSSNQRRHFQSWVQQTVNTLSHDGEVDPDELKIHVMLKPPHLRRFKLTVTAMVEITELEVFGGDDDESSQHAILKLLFSRLSWLLNPQVARTPRLTQRSDIGTLQAMTL